LEMPMQTGISGVKAQGSNFLVKLFEFSLEFHIFSNTSTRGTLKFKFEYRANLDCTSQNFKKWYSQSLTPY